MRFIIKLLVGICLGIVVYNQSLFAAGFYLQELGTPSSIGTAGTARTVNLSVPCSLLNSQFTGKI